MTTRGWTVLIYTTEADLSIAQSIQVDDIVISKDSDMLAYGSVVTLWHPVSKNVILEYKVSGLLRTLSFTPDQLAALAVVSRNDYHRNMYSLGLASNFGIIKKIGHREGDFLMVASFLLCALPLQKILKCIFFFSNRSSSHRCSLPLGQPGHPAFDIRVLDPSIRGLPTATSLSSQS